VQPNPEKISSVTTEQVERLSQWFNTAIHEAGHAVTGELLGFPCRYIQESFWVHDRRTTRLLRSWPNSDKALKQYADYGIATIAGIAAEAIEAGGYITDYLRAVPGRADYKALTVIARRVSLSNLDLLTLCPARSEASLIAEWETKSIELLKANWNWVTDVAGLFIECEGMLSGNDVRSCRPPKCWRAA
jgi:hypothetical protein